ncbi:hypothetical protein QBC46DRAFT_358840 [Diplogelasinospora grovesii]|uniref:Uncharacterized protein n=1 Tax=Diplogelasinospora grovesii TaxID=303347 RepID=A0AAN6MWC5_9PEZI|nr:hypothetical protein QBC46DRAFT_358840 [Diplogelasinospora grovesii]
MGWACCGCLSPGKIAENAVHDAGNNVVDSIKDKGGSGAGDAKKTADNVTKNIGGGFPSKSGNKRIEAYKNYNYKNYNYNNNNNIIINNNPTKEQQNRSVQKQQQQQQQQHQRATASLRKMDSGTGSSNENAAKTPRKCKFIENICECVPTECRCPHSLAFHGFEPPTTNTPAKAKKKKAKKKNSKESCGVIEGNKPRSWLRTVLSRVFCSNGPDEDANNVPLRMVVRSANREPLE